MQVRVSDIFGSTCCMLSAQYVHFIQPAALRTVLNFVTCGVCNLLNVDLHAVVLSAAESSVRKYVLAGHVLLLQVRWLPDIVCIDHDACAAAVISHLSCARVCV